jgi:Holliday junction resolvase RusA-like endonuclease
VKLTLPLPPSLNNLYANTARGRWKTEEGRTYQRQVQTLAAYQGAEWLGKAEVEVHYWFHMNRRGDVSNRVKAVEDALTGVIWENDRQVRRFTAERVPPDGEPYVEVEITEIEA